MFKGKYEAKQEFQEGGKGGASNQKTFHGRAWIFPGTTYYRARLALIPREPVIKSSVQALKITECL